MFAGVMCQGQQCGVPGSPSAFETDFGWVLAGEANSSAVPSELLAHHIIVDTGDDLLQKFWEVEEQPWECSIVRWLREKKWTEWTKAPMFFWWFLRS